MTIRLRLLTGSLSLFIMAGNGYAGPLIITHFSVHSNTVNLGWNSTTDRHIVAQASNLRTDQFQFVGAVLSTNQAALTNSLPSAFYWVRQVAVVDFPDPILSGLVTNQITTWYEPSSLIYDIDLWGITYINAASRSITDATGIGWLTALASLYIGENQLTNLNVTGCTNLQILYCFNNQLTNLNFSGCAALQDLECEYNQLTNLNVAGLTNLQTLYCYNNYLANLNVSGCTHLQTLLCAFDQLTNLNVSGSTALDDLECNDNPLTNLDVSGFANLRYLNCQYDQLTNLNVSGCTNLKTLYCDSNYLTNLNVSGCTNLTVLGCSFNQLTDLSSLVSNAAAGGLGSGDTVYLFGNPLSSFAQTNQIPYLQSKGVTIH